MARPNVREQIVEVALEHFHQRGFNGTSVDDITRAAGVPKGSFYNHFKSKEDLAIEAVTRYSETGRHKSLIDQQRSPLKRLKEYFAYLGKSFIELEHTRGCMIGNFANEMADHSPAIQARLKAIFEVWVGALASVIAEGQAAGEISSARDPEDLAALLLSAWEGTLIRARCTQDAGPLRQFNDVAFAMLLK
jgi:TetR/AcrR family transcriptional regulator, transcriptional repressor for nem operon